MFEVVIVEDEQPILTLMELLIGRNTSFTVKGAFTNPLEALACLHELKPDVLFLDVEMPAMSGLELAQQVMEHSEHTHIVFTTAYKQYALKAFDVDALDYIVKPVTPEAIERVRNRLVKQRGGMKDKNSASAMIPIRSFGGFEVWDAQGKLVHFPTRKTGELFAYMLCHADKDIDKWQLVDLLWPDKDGERALHNLHNTIYRVKKVLLHCELGMNLVKTTQGYMLESGNGLYDLKAFQQAGFVWEAATFDRARSEQLYSWYQGALFAGKEYVWKLPLEEQFRNVYERLVRMLMRDDLLQGEQESAEQRFHACLTVEPDHTELHIRLLEIYAGSVHKDRMRRQYASLEAFYREQLGVEQLKELKRRAASILE
ncbi:response regulator [Marinicrinis sediminis]|uniref:Response regulator n=1 Tax=Marinicrinis sediminis TaxID=1652465 RepID=A0ABW5R8R8_9BACL